MRWVNVKAEHTISWSIRPDKKSINFGIFKHPGSGQAPTPNLPSSTFELPPISCHQPDDALHESHSSKISSSTATEKLKSIGLKPVLWYGTCEANRVSTGTYNVPRSEGGMYALVFDNTFAKSFSKSATFVLLTYPTSSPPQNHHIHHIQGTSGEGSASLKDTLNTKMAALQRKSSDSGGQVGSSKPVSHRGSDESRSKQQVEVEINLEKNFFTGVLQKKRRKRNQGWARRFFSLDYTSSTLSYYQNRNTLAVRGVVPLSLAAIGANAKTKQISIDSGAEIWLLKAANQKSFEAWKRALELARSSASPTSPALAMRLDTRGRRMSAGRTSSVREQDWAKVEDLATKVRKSRELAKALAKDTDPKYFSSNALNLSLDRHDSAPPSGTSSNSGSPSEPSLPNGFFNESERRPFWKRKSSREPSRDRPMPGLFRSVSATPSTNTFMTAAPSPIRTSSFITEGRPLQSHPEEEGLHDRCMALLRSLDSIVSEFGHLTAERKQRHEPTRSSTVPRHSIDTQGSTEEFFDAEGGNASELLAIHHETDEEGGEADHGFASDEDSASASDVDEPTVLGKQLTNDGKATPAFPPKPRSFDPLPAQWVKRRIAVPAPTVSPPSLIGFLRKNVGKDLSTISMPVTANEPISLLQRLSETLEYSTLLDDAVNKERSSTERLVYLAAFAVSQLSSMRVKERAIRKPFNPMLGETFELVRGDRGFRFLAEKISHRPVRMACQAESEKWTFSQSPLPTQKFWGKSAEFVTEGKFRVVLHQTSDRFSWSPATSFLRNIIAGEKYVEPVGIMTVVNETTGEKAVVSFKSKGMFSGRSEDVAVQTYDAYDDELPLGLVGRWTSSLSVTEHGNMRDNESAIWTAAELPPEAAKRYGFTTFAASLNEVTTLEEGKLPPTDSRLRPDQRAAEDGDFDEAEILKAKLEEAQRERRKVMEEEGTVWTPKWFERIEGGDDGGDEVWAAKEGTEGYWEQRKEGKWWGVERVFDVLL